MSTTLNEHIFIIKLLVTKETECRCKRNLKVCSHLAFASTSPSKLNIASMETQTQMHRMGLNPFLTFYINTMLNVYANANVKCEHTIRFVVKQLL